MKKKEKEAVEKRNAYISRYVYLGNLRRQKSDNFGDGCDFEGGPDYDDQVDELSVVVDETAVEFVWQVFSEKGDVRLGQT